MIQMELNWSRGGSLYSLMKTAFRRNGNVTKETYLTLIYRERLGSFSFCHKSQLCAQGRHNMYHSSAMFYFETNAILPFIEFLEGEALIWHQTVNNMSYYYSKLTRSLPLLNGISDWFKSLLI